MQASYLTTMSILSCRSPVPHFRSTGDWSVDNLQAFRDSKKWKLLEDVSTMLVVSGGVMVVRRSTNELVMFEHNLNWSFDRY